MNIFQKISFFNRALKAFKEVQKKIETTTIDDELKDIFATLVNCIERLKNKVPEATAFFTELIDIVKNNLKKCEKKK